MLKVCQSILLQIAMNLVNLTDNKYRRKTMKFAPAILNGSAVEDHTKSPFFATISKEDCLLCGGFLARENMVVTSGSCIEGSVFLLLR
jgi:hypothetical protein